MPGSDYPVGTVEKKHIVFIPAEANAKTFCWDVWTRDGKILGRVSWYAPWRKYCYLTGGRLCSVYEQQCLRDIADFIEEQTRLHKEKKYGKP